MFGCYVKDTPIQQPATPGYRAAPDALKCIFDYPVELNADATQETSRSHAAVNARLNASTLRVPMHKLPPEILAQVFTLAVPSHLCYHTRKYYDPLLNILLVCTQWYQIAISTPSLWTHVDFYCAPSTQKNRHLSFEKAGAWLNRARGSPLEVHFCTNEHLLDRDEVSLVSALLKPRATAIESFTILGNSADDLLLAMLSLYPKATPTSLKTLTASGHARPGDLRDRLAWPMRLFHGLIDLDLSYLSINVSPTVDELFSVLSSNPSLRSLRLRRVTIRSIQNRYLSTISLPHLQLLDITGLETSVISILLPLLAPDTLEMDFRLDLCGDQDASRAILAFLRRSNITSLTVQDVRRDSQAEFSSYLSAAPQLRVLLAHFPTYAPGYILDAITFLSETETSRRLPYLHSLALFGMYLRPAEINRLEKIASVYSLHNIAFVNCRFPVPDYELDCLFRKENIVPRELNSWLSARVGSVLVEKFYIDDNSKLDVFVQMLSHVDS